MSKIVVFNQTGSADVLEIKNVDVVVSFMFLPSDGE